MEVGGKQTAALLAEGRQVAMRSVGRKRAGGGRGKGRPRRRGRWASGDVVGRQETGLAVVEERKATASQARVGRRRCGRWMGNRADGGRRKGDCSFAGKSRWGSDVVGGQEAD